MRAAELLARVLARCSKIGHLINQSTFAEDGNEQVAVFHTGGNLRLLLGLKIYNYTGFACPMIEFVNRVGDKSAIRLMEPPALQQARNCRFRALIGKFNAILPLTAGATYAAEVISPAYG